MSLVGHKAYLVKCTTFVRYFTLYNQEICNYRVYYRQVFAQERKPHILTLITLKKSDLRLFSLHCVYMRYISGIALLHIAVLR